MNLYTVENNLWSLGKDGPALNTSSLICHSEHSSLAWVPSRKNLKGNAPEGMKELQYSIVLK